MLNVYSVLAAQQQEPPEAVPIPLPEPGLGAGIQAQEPGGSGVDVDVNPSSTGAPGVETIQTLLDWLAQYSLWACLAALLAGGGLFAWGRRNGGHGMAMTGTALAGGGAVGAVIVGLAPAIVNALYSQT